MDFKTRTVFSDRQCRSTTADTTIMKSVERRSRNSDSVGGYLDPSATRRPYMLPVFAVLVSTHTYMLDNTYCCFKIFSCLDALPSFFLASNQYKYTTTTNTISSSSSTRIMRKQ
jgi:hypothetical protein